MPKTSLKALTLGAVLRWSSALVQPRRLTSCSFANEPQIPYYWDESCPQDGHSLGCLADGEHAQCRFCGAGDYGSVPCPVSSCSFGNPPHLPYYWDASCEMGQIGCNADGGHVQCRFCGEFPFNGTVPCPTLGTVSPVDACSFDNEPVTPYFWDSSCEAGALGCQADGEHLGCRFCGGGEYSEVTCPASLCTFGTDGVQVPVAPYGYYWEPECWGESGMALGCMADGIHHQCRFCGHAEYEGIPCP